jgi:SAM-dependent methyltransferase
MTYEHPLGYVLGLEGIALMRAFTGEFDREFTEARFAEIRRLLDDESLLGAGVVVERLETVDGYRSWAATYDEPGNSLIEAEEPVVRDILDTFSPGTALDAACGTGRHADYLASHGHRVVGVDSSPDMLAQARNRVPSAEFRLGDLRRLPLGDAEVDTVVCGLALSHVPVLEPVIAEFARVLRPGGNLVISDIHHEYVFRGANHPMITPDGARARLFGHRHRAGEYLSAALPLGLQVRSFHEECRFKPEDHHPTPTRDPGPWDDWPWSLNALIPDAVRAANAGIPETSIWHFQLAEV